MNDSTGHPLLGLPARDLFPLWAAERRRTPRRPLSEKTIAAYAPIWSLWCDHLMEAHTPWPLATSDTLAAFVRRRPARSRRHPVASTVTLNRYWRLIQDVYRTVPLICLSRSMEPLELALARVDAPPDAATDAADPTVVPASTLRTLYAALAEPLPNPVDDDVRQPWAHVRNRALLAAQLDTAATVRELARLSVHDVLQPALQTPPQPVTMRLAGGSPHALRTLPLSTEGAAWVLAWLELRAQLPCPTDALFVSAKGMKPLTHVSMWRTLSAAVRQTMEREGQQLPYHFGPNMLRNSVVLAWLEARRLPLPTLATRAGFKSPRSLSRLLAHASDAVRAEYAALAAQGMPLASAGSSSGDAHGA